jgi:hypothetical protein
VIDDDFDKSDSECVFLPIKEDDPKPIDSSSSMNVEKN